MPRVRSACLLSVVALLGCANAVPCSNCPPVDGVYSVAWPDAGPVVTGGCIAEGPRPATWTFVQKESTVTTTIAGVAVGGTYFDSYDMALSGAQSGVNYRLRALAIPTGEVDAGIELRGSLTTRLIDETTGDLCEVTDSYTAQRISR